MSKNKLSGNENKRIHMSSSKLQIPTQNATSRAIKHKMLSKNKKPVAPISFAFAPWAQIEVRK